MVFSTPQLINIAKPLSDHLFSLLRTLMASSLTLSQLGKDCRSGPGFSPTSSSPFSISLTPATVLSFLPPSRGLLRPRAFAWAESSAWHPLPFTPSRLPAPPSFGRCREDSYLPAEWPACLSCLLATVPIIRFFIFFISFLSLSTRM